MLFTTCMLCPITLEPPWVATIQPTVAAQGQASGTLSTTPASLPCPPAKCAPATPTCSSTNWPARPPECSARSHVPSPFPVVAPLPKFLKKTKTTTTTTHKPDEKNKREAAEQEWTQPGQGLEQAAGLMSCGPAGKIAWTWSQRRPVPSASPFAFVNLWASYVSETTASVGSRPSLRRCPPQCPRLRGDSALWSLLGASPPGRPRLGEAGAHLHPHRSPVQSPKTPMSQEPSSRC